MRNTIRTCVAVLLAIAAGPVSAGPWIDPGDMALRHDIQLLADAGVIQAPVTSWPLSWGDVLGEIKSNAPGDSRFDPALDAALTRVRRLGERSVGGEGVVYSIDAHYDTQPTLLRGFEDRAREDTDVQATASWMGDRFAASLSVSGVSNPDDDQGFRLDGSYVGVAIGNFMVSAGAMERWWGPGYDGSLILGNNHRPIPAISVERNDTEAFDSPWLSWLGPWDLSFVWGQLENDRAVPNARFLGLRFNFKPLSTLEIGLSRTAQWCGNGDRPCDLDTLGRILIGRDNVGDDNVDRSNEPGNQLAGLDFRWQPREVPLNGALYGQFIGEDEAGGFPSKFLGQLGAEVSGYFDGLSYRAFVEYSGTSCQFNESSSIPNCAYNTSVYPTGYRYKGRAIGHSADNDSDVLTFGVSVVERDGDYWQFNYRDAELNSDGEPDPANSISATPLDYQSVELSYRTALTRGQLEVGVGLVRTVDGLTGQSKDDSRVFLGWRVPF